MNAAVHYWQFNRLNNQGEVKVEEIAEAKSFIQEQCLDLAQQIPFSDSTMQRYLFALLTDNDSTVTRMAQICLRCFISEQIKQVCINLERQFGNNHHFNRYDLFPFVLDDTLEHWKQPESTTYISMSAKILQTFDPQQASLSTWTTRLVRYERNLNHFLVERGLYLISDWAILNDTRASQLQRILREFHHFNGEAISHASLLLESYHRIYRLERLATRKAGIRGKCPTPSTEQLQQIATLVGMSLTPEKTLTQLQDLAERLREYRIYVRGGKLEQDSLDHPDIMIKVEQEQVAEYQNNFEEQAQEEFLNRYHQQFSASLKQAINQVIPKRLSQLKNLKKQQFLLALKLFYCQGFSMTNIAPVIGLKAQYQVSRLMQLRNFRSDIRQQMLQNLQHQILEMAAIYIEPEQLKRQERLIEIALEEEVNSMIEQAETEAIRARNRPLRSIFAQSLCHYLYLKENSND